MSLGDAEQDRYKLCIEMTSRRSLNCLLYNNNQKYESGSIAKIDPDSRFFGVSVTKEI